MGPQPPCALRVRGGAGPSASLPLLRDVPHRGRRGASHPTPRRHERDPCYYSDTLLAMTAGTGKSPDAIVVGGGFAGLAAATHLAQDGARLLLLEARPHLGGRARSWVDPDTGSVVDNGQHL